MSESTVFDYEKDGAAIYRESFATIRAEADLAGLPADVSQVAVRMIHACGMVDLVRDLAFSPRVVADARKALRDGAPILCDANMVASGVTRKRLPAGNDVICTLTDPSVPGLAERLGTTRSAAAMALCATASRLRRRHRQRPHRALPPPGDDRGGRPASGRRPRHPGRLRRRRRVQGRARRAPLGPGVPGRTGPSRRQRDGAAAINAIASEEE